MENIKKLISKQLKIIFLDINSDEFEGFNIKNREVTEEEWKDEKRKTAERHAVNECITIEKLKDIHERYERQLSELKTENENIRRDYQEEIRQLREKTEADILQLKAEIRQFKADNEQLKEEIRRLKEKNEKLRSDFMLLNKKFIDLMGNNSCLKKNHVPELSKLGKLAFGS